MTGAKSTLQPVSGSSAIDVAARCYNSTFAVDLFYDP